MNALDRYYFSLDRSADIHGITTALRGQNIDARLLYSTLVILGKEGAERARTYLNGRGLRFVYLKPGCRNACCQERES